MEKGYKVVCTENGKHYSHIMGSRRGVRYKIGKTSKPRCGCGPLLIYKKLEPAKEYANLYDLSDTRVFECEYTPSKYAGAWTRRLKYHRPLSDSIGYAKKVILIKEVEYK